MAVPSGPSRKFAVSEEHTSDAVAGDDHAVVARIQAGDEVAFNDLVRRFHDPLRHFLQGNVGSGAAPELVQELFWNIWRMRREWTVRSTVASYLFQAARHAAQNWRRREGLHVQWQHQVRLQGDAGVTDSALMGAFGEGPDERPETTELRETLRRAIEGLPPRCRQVAMLRFMDDYTYPQIAEALGVTVKAVEGQMAKAVPVLRNAMRVVLGR